MAANRTRLAGKKAGGAPTGVESISFDARDTLCGRYDDALVAQLGEVDHE